MAAGRCSKKACSVSCDEQQAQLCRTGKLDAHLDDAERAERGGRLRPVLAARRSLRAGLLPDLQHRRGCRRERIGPLMPCTTAKTHTNSQPSFYLLQRMPHAGQGNVTHRFETRGLGVLPPTLRAAGRRRVQQLARAVPLRASLQPACKRATISGVFDAALMAQHKVHDPAPAAHLRRDNRCRPSQSCSWLRERAQGLKQ